MVILHKSINEILTMNLLVVFILPILSYFNVVSSFASDMCCCGRVDCVSSRHHQLFGQRPKSALPWRGLAQQNPVSTIKSSSSTHCSSSEVPSITDSCKKKSTEWLIQWRQDIFGEGSEGYSSTLRQWEFTSAFRAELASYLKNTIAAAFSTNFNYEGAYVSDDIRDLTHYLEKIEFEFYDALLYQGPIRDPSTISTDDQNADFSTHDAEAIPLSQVQDYESAMQYVVILDKNASCNLMESIINRPALLTNLFRSAVERCSLVRRMVRVVAEGGSYEEIANEALKNGSFEDMIENGANVDATWSIRLRRYGSGQYTTAESVKSKIDNDNDNRSTNANTKRKRRARYGKNIRSSLEDEKNAILSMSELIKLFQGGVNLMNPDCKIYVLEGLRDSSTRHRNSEKKSNILLGRIIADGPKTSIFSPKTRICVTTTPLCPIASFTLCNIAQIERHTKTTILDPFAGSCATLLAAAHITKGECRSVGIEICHDGYVNRNDIKRDFESRSLPPPLVIRGDCLTSEVRDKARDAIGGNECSVGFDVIVTDPPYGIREAMSSSHGKEIDNTPPLTQLFQAIGHDRANGKPLLKVGGRLAAFVPVRKGETLAECLPPDYVQKDAGLVMEGEGKEQVLNDILSRWLVSFVSV